MPASVTVGSFTPSVLLDLARTTGRLEALDLAVTEVPVASSPAQFRDLVDGRLDLALTSPDNVLAYRFSPGNPLGELFDVRIVSAVDRGMGLGLYARPGLHGRGPARRPGRRRRPHLGLRARALRARRLARRCARRTTSWSRSARRRAGSRRCWPATATPPCSTPATSSSPSAPGCSRLASVADVAGPYLGTVVAVAGETRLAEARRLAAALTATAAELVGGGLDDEAREAAARRLDLDDELAGRYVARLRSPSEGLVPDGRVDPDAIATLVGLRRRYLPDGLARPRRHRRAGRPAGGTVKADPGRHRLPVDPAAAADRGRQHAGPVRDAADAGRDRRRPRRAAVGHRARRRRLLPRLRPDAAGLGHRLRHPRPGPHDAADAAARRTVHDRVGVRVGPGVPRRPPRDRGRAVRRGVPVPADLHR